MTERPVFPPLLRPFALTPDVRPFERCLELAHRLGFEGKHGVMWTVRRSPGAVEYATRCTTVTLD